MTQLCDQNHCTGCGACVAVCPTRCIRMEADGEGFLYPKVDESNCINCGKCAKACPVLNPPQKAERLPVGYAAYTKDETVRKNSSSGGIFTEIAKVVLQQGGAVFGAAYSDRFEVVHICVEDLHNLEKLWGAKYAQSNLRDSFLQAKHRLENGQTVLFSGTPCQIAGLKSFLGRSYENLLTVDFVCHSVPSPMAWEQYVRYRSGQDNNGNLPVVINLRNKETGWSRYQYSNVFAYDNGVTHMSPSGNSLYMKLFVGGYISRKSCEMCQFKGYNRCSDLTIGDFWGIWDIAPEMDDNKGTSLILIQTEPGEKLFAKIADQLEWKQVTLEETSRQNPAMLRASQAAENRAEILALIRQGKFEKCLRIMQQKHQVRHLFRRMLSWGKTNRQKER